MRNVPCRLGCLDTWLPRSAQLWDWPDWGDSGNGKWRNNRHVYRKARIRWAMHSDGDAPAAWKFSVYYIELSEEAGLLYTAEWEQLDISWDLYREKSQATGMVRKKRQLIISTYIVSISIWTRGTWVWGTGPHHKAVLTMSTIDIHLGLWRQINRSLCVLFCFPLCVHYTSHFPSLAH